ncbi:hypothetical protein ACFC00_17610 [Streptomyces adustus]|uniref:hypothetical protein n=1 Tax=Streptomyces adustus TaxID=1609272 RepID=UPI0035E1C238
MTNGSPGMPLASLRWEIFKFAFQFVPDWGKNTMLALAALAVVGSGLLKLRRRIRHRRAVRAGAPLPAPARYGQGRGADYLGAYAPQRGQLPQNPAPAGPGGADFLGAHAPGQAQAQAQGRSGAD